MADKEVKFQLNVLATPAQAAQMLNLSEFTLAGWRVQGKGPQYVKLSRGAVRYRISALDDFIEKNTLNHTSEQ